MLVTLLDLIHANQKSDMCLLVSKGLQYRGKLLAGENFDETKVKLHLAK